MYTLVFTNARNERVAERFDTLDAAEAEAGAIRDTMRANGMGAYTDGVRVMTTDDYHALLEWERDEDARYEALALVAEAAGNAAEAEAIAPHLDIVRDCVSSASNYIVSTSAALDAFPRVAVERARTAARHAAYARKAAQVYAYMEGGN